MASLIRYGLIEFIVTAKKLQFFTSGLVAGCVGFAKLFVCATQPSDGELRLGELRLEDFAGAVPSSPAYACAVFYPGSHTTFPFEFFLFVVRSLLLWGAFVLLWHYDALVEGGRVALRALRGQQKLRHEVQRFVRFVRFVTSFASRSFVTTSVAGSMAPQHATAACQCSPRRPPPPQERRGLHWLPTTIGLLVLSWSLWLAIFWLVALNLYQVPRWWDEPLARWLDLLLVCTCVQLFINRLLTFPCVTATPAKVRPRPLHTLMTF